MQTPPQSSVNERTALHAEQTRRKDSIVRMRECNRILWCGVTNCMLNS